MIGRNILVRSKYHGYYMRCSAFSKTWLPPELRRVLSCKSPAVFPTISTRGKGALGPLLSAPTGASKRETPTSNLTESTGLEIRTFAVIVFTGFAKVLRRLSVTAFSAKQIALSL